MVDRLRAVPAWATLAAIVILSFAVRAWLARGMLGPFIMVDELIYSEMAKSFASDLQLRRPRRPRPRLRRRLPDPDLAPAYALFDRIPDVYATVKTINSLVMSLAAVPAYLIARRVVGKWSALLAALLTVAVPSMVYTATVMTENAYYPVFLLAALALVALLERPSTRNHVLFFAALGAGVPDPVAGDRGRRCGGDGADPPRPVPARQPSGRRCGRTGGSTRRSSAARCSSSSPRPRAGCR